MNILLINQFPLNGGGSGIYTKNIAKNLKSAGHNVYIIIPENTTQIEKIDGVTIKPIFFKHKENIKNQLPFNFGCFTTHPRSSITFNEYTEEQLSMYIKAFENAIENAIKEFKPDIIHSGHIWLVSSIASKYNIPTIITSHGTDLIGYNSWKSFHKYCEEAIERCSKIITISDSNTERVLTAFPKAKDKIIQVRNGYDQSIFKRKVFDRKEILKQLGIEGEYESIVLFSGRLVQVKGIDILLKAAKIYEKDNILTLIAGEGILHKELQTMVKKLNLKNVKFLGNKDQATLNKLYNISDVSVLPSRYEGFALVVIESLATGTPIVASNIDSVKDLIKDEFGVIVEKENAEELAKGINCILSKKEKYNGEKIAKYIKENYSQTLLINDVIEVYKSCL